jgi:UDP-N-acetylglucosamine diphosphorylase/glucosamine-1-phosphate N-acetyltransferase
MIKINFFSDPKSSSLYPFDLTRCVSTLHFGGRTISAQWEEVLSRSKLGEIALNSRLLPTADSVAVVKSLNTGQTWLVDGVVLAERKGDSKTECISADVKPMLVGSAADLFELCGLGIEEDLERAKRAWSTRTWSEDEREAWALAGVIVHGDIDRIHVAPGAKIRSCTLNTEEGHIVIGPDSEIMEGTNIRGPLMLGAFSSIRMGSQIYGPTSIGAHCKVGGEISNCVIHDYSNKAHGGFLGNSVLGSWCNLGAGTSCSNLKNTYGEIGVWDEKKKAIEKSGRIFCGLLMGDHSKTAILTAFNTGTVVGAFCNIFGAGTPNKHIPSFTWGGGEQSEDHDVKKAVETARKVMLRRGVEMSAEQKKEIKELHKSTSADRE